MSKRADDAAAAKRRDKLLKRKPEEIETEPDGWERFTKAVKRMAPPKPKRTKTKPRKSLRSV